MTHSSRVTRLGLLASALAALTVAVVIGGGIGGFRAGGAAEPAPPPATDVAPVTSIGGVPVRPVAMVATAGGEFPAPSVVDELVDGTVLRVVALGFSAQGSGRVEQCVIAAGRLGSCGNSFPVEFDQNGNARFQYLVTATFLPTGLSAPADCTSPLLTCAVRLVAGSRSAVAGTVFGAAFSRGVVTIMPEPTALEDGSVITVRAHGLAPDTIARVVVCAAPAISGRERCGAPGPHARLRVDSEGRGSARLTIRGTRVGDREVECNQDVECGVSVTSATGTPLVQVVGISFSRGPGASYQGSRLVFGLAAAAVLVLFALYLFRTTDWRKPTEADTPALDAATFLDDIEALDEELSPATGSRSSVD